MAYLLEVVDLQTLPPALSVLSEREQLFWQTLKLPKRRTEWLGGRLALKKLLSAHAGRALQDWEVLTPGGVGKPVIYAAGQKVDIPFSITHSHGFAVAAIAPQARYIGIDLEQVASRIHAWKQDFFHPSELLREDDAFLTTLWTQKEALVKLLGTGLTINTLDVRVVGGRAQFFDRALQIYQDLGSPAITLETRPLIPGFIFSVAIA